METLWNSGENRTAGSIIPRWIFVHADCRRDRHVAQRRNRQGTSVGIAATNQHHKMQTAGDARRHPEA